MSILRRTGKGAFRLVDSLSIVLLLIAAWSIWVYAFDAPEYVMPGPWSVVHTMVSDWHYLFDQAWVTLQEFVLGFLLSVAVGIPLAILIASFRPFERVVYPVIVTSQVVPKIAIAPLFLIWLGFGMSSKILIAFLIAFFPIVIETVAGLRAVPTEMLHLARSTGAGSTTTLLKIKLPHALPHIFVGLKLAIVFSVTGAIVGEFAGADRGLGKAIIAASATLDTPFTFAAVGYITILGFLAFFGIVLLERAVVPWHVSRRHAQPA